MHSTRSGSTTTDIAHRYPGEFSGGQLQRISIARALLTQPPLLVADEPVSMVDASLRMSIVNLFEKIRDEFGISVIYITHDHRHGLLRVRQNRGHVPRQRGGDG